MILILGADGQLGRELTGMLGDQCKAMGRNGIDLGQPEQIQQTLKQLAPRVIINCAAYTAVDLAEDDRDQCYRINAEAVKHLSTAATELGATLVQISTDYVFAGETSALGPINEERAVSPLGVYAKSKWEGEQHAQRCPQHLIIRTCGLYGLTPTRKNFVETMLRLGSQREELTIVNDQFCNPTSTKVLATGVLELLKTHQTGIFNVVSSPGLCWSDFAKEIFAQAKLPTRVKEITTEQYGARAPRPRYSVLDTSKFEQATGMRLPSIAAGLAEYLERRSLASV